MTATAGDNTKRPNEWWVGVVSGMASYIDAAAIVSSGIALVLYQQAGTVTATEIGVLSAALTFSIAIGALTGGRLGDLFGRRSVFIATMAMVVIGSGLLVASNGYVLLMIATILVGLGTGADLPVSLATVSEAASDRTRGKLVAFSQVLWFAGILGTQLTALFVGGLGRVGGQIMFGSVGIIALVVMLLRLTIPESDKWTGLATRSAPEPRPSGPSASESATSSPSASTWCRSWRSSCFTRSRTSGRTPVDSSAPTWP